MKRVVITGMGIVSCLGNDKATVADALKNGRSGIKANPVFAEMGFRCQVSGRPEIDLDALIERKARRFQGDTAGYAWVAMQQAIADAGLTPEQVSNPRTGLIAGSGGPSTAFQVEAARIAVEKGVKRVGPYMVPKCMSSTVSACLATGYQIKGLNFTIASACATSAHCIGSGYEQIQFGKQDIVFAGGAEEDHWTIACLFDAMGAMSSKYNDTPATASRAYDATRDGFVLSAGGGMLVLEEYEHAVKRGAKIYAEIIGYAATSDGYDMVAPNGEGAERCMKLALQTVEGKVDYINAHGTSTPVGDSAELGAIRRVFGTDGPKISSTKSLSGHSLGAAGVQEAIYSLLMLEEDFIAGSANITTIDPEAADMPIVRETIYNAGVKTVLSNSFGFGGTNATLVFRKI